jgi:hypothetical protein
MGVRTQRFEVSTLYLKDSHSSQAINVQLCRKIDSGNRGLYINIAEC